MGDAKKIVVDGYPVEKLPEDLRVRLGATGVVRLTIEEPLVAGTKLRLVDLYGCGAGFYQSHGHEPAQFVSTLRDEWS
jgi:hypothetical protein